MSHEFADIGDVVKHLALTELFSAWSVEGYPVSRYLESHAGQAYYRWDDAPDERTHDARCLSDEAMASDDFVLDWTTYLELVREDITDGLYPSSPIMAFHTLRQAREYVFFDLSKEALNTVGNASRLHEIEEYVSLHNADGLAGVSQMAQPGDFVLLDPFELHERVGDGPDSVEVFRDLSQRGIATLLWYPLQGSLSVKDAIASLGGTQHMEFILAQGHNAGLAGCGLASAHLPDAPLVKMQNMIAHLADFWGAQLIITNTSSSATSK